ncbi:MAG: membrane protein insertion efficiency factor YidD [Clostridiales bacterium]|nr:membrane protein insertion efficiency factor YidD [Clostridiales bacterium]MCD8126379.1 membrane protein insertion efficiency factor YidD [Clostridiales bacterium]
MKRVLLALIRFYRTQISPGLPPRCRFLPTCSEYAAEAIEKYGPARGSLLAAKRLAKCQPFHRQKSIEYDPVP